MPAPSDLDPLYQEWLEIPVERLPPNHYAILGLSDFESDADKIEAAAKARGAYLHQIAAGPQRKIVQKMLGQVAIARRTLMNDSTRREYDQSLCGASAASESGESSLSDRGPADSTNGASKSTDNRWNPGHWKYQAISGVVLLITVGVLYSINRNPGGRRAAQPLSTEPKSSTDASTKPMSSNQPGSSTSAVSDPAHQNHLRMAPAVPSVDSSRSRRSPIASRRDTGSGLGMGLDDKFGDVLTDIAKQPEKGPPHSSGNVGAVNGFQPLAGLSVGPVNKNVKPNQWPSDLVAVDAFPGAVADRFECDRGFHWFDARENQLHIKTASGKNFFQLKDRAFQLTPGSSVSLTTSLASKMPSEIKLGFAVDGMWIGLRPSKNGIELIVRDQGEDARIDSVTKIKTDSAKTNLTIVRDGENKDKVHWFIKTGGQTQTGEIGLTALGDQPSVSLFVAAPKKETTRPLWVADLMVRQGTQ